MMKKVIWLCKPNFSGALLSLQRKFLYAAELNPVGTKPQFRFVELTRGCKYKRTKKQYDYHPHMRQRFFDRLTTYNPDFIVIQDDAALFYITNGRYKSLDQCRGSIYYWQNIPCLVVDNVHKTRFVPEAAWLMKNDMRKLKRWLEGAQRQTPKFNYKICEAIADVQELNDAIYKAKVAAIDIETTGIIISCIGYALLMPDGRISTYVVPLYNPRKPNGAHWQDAKTEEHVWQLLQCINDSHCFKIMQNGSYDSAYFIRYNIPLRNYFFDTAHIWHSIWPEAKKRLDRIASVALDFYTFWKDEGKDENDDVKSGAVPQSEEGFRNYLRYNALDCHNTLASCVWLVSVLDQLPWALRNYVSEFHRQIGPCLRMSMQGMHLNDELRRTMLGKLRREAISETEILHTMVADQDFNHKSPQQVKELVYDILGAEPLPRKGTSTDEKILKILQTQDFLLKVIIEQIWKAKKPANNVSKYEKRLGLGSRFMFKLHAGTTPTERLASRQHDFWVGTNAQNLPKSMRVMLEADSDCVLLDIDYSQSDNYFSAFQSQDEKFINTMTSGMDTHCFHAAHFFKVDYDKLLAAHKRGEDWSDHPTRGIRQITKRVVYGSNYLMSGYTLLITMGIESTVAAAKFLGHEDAHTWNVQRLTHFCEQLLNSYYELYPNIKPELQRDAARALKNGRLASTAFGYTRLFFDDILRNDKAHREFAAFFGQGGTAGNINKAIKTIFTDLMRKYPHGVLELKLQVHDSLIIQLHKDYLHVVPEIIAAMENTCQIKGREFVVPVEADIGIGWGKRMIPWHENITYQEIVQHDEQWLANYYKEVFSNVA